MGKRINQEVMIFSVISATVLSVVAFMFRQNVQDLTGIFFGMLVRLVGFYQIVRLSSKIEHYDKTERAAKNNYVTRYLFYGVTVYILMDSGVHVLAVLAGLLSVNISIFIVSYRNRKEEG